MGHNRGGDNRRARLKRFRRELDRLAEQSTPEAPKPAVRPAAPKETGAQKSSPKGK